MTDTTAVTTAPNKPPIMVLRERLEARRSELANALGKEIEPDEFIRSLLTSVQINPELLGCSWQSIWTAVMRACRDKLRPDGREGAIVPFKSQAQWIPMVQGLIKRFRQSGECRWIGADVVREGETFEKWVDEDGEHFKHVPGDDETKPVVKVYAAAKLKTGGFHSAVLNMATIEKIRKMSRATREDAPWRVWPEEMAKKTALRRLAKMLPSGPITIDAEAEEMFQIAGGPTLIAKQPTEAPETATDALNRFAAAPSEVHPIASKPEEGQDAGGAVPPNADPAGVTEFPDIPDDPADPDPLTDAYARGQRDKAAGMSRRALPPEFRTAERSREQMAWQCGFDGKQMPEWSDAS